MVGLVLLPLASVMQLSGTISVGQMLLLLAIGVCRLRNRLDLEHLSDRLGFVPKPTEIILARSVSKIINTNEMPLLLGYASGRCLEAKPSYSLGRS